MWIPLALLAASDVRCTDSCFYRYPFSRGSLRDLGVVRRDAVAGLNDQAGFRGRADFGNCLCVVLRYQ